MHRPFGWKVVGLERNESALFNAAAVVAMTPNWNTVALMYIYERTYAYRSDGD